VAITGVILAAACGKGTSNDAVFTEPPFTPEVTLAPSGTPAASGSGSNQLQFHTLVGQTIVLHVNGFQPGENVTFTVTKPDGTSFTGPPHVVSQNGTVEARYAPPLPGTYNVVAKGDRGGQSTSQFIVSSSYTAPPQATSRTTTRRFSTPRPTRTAAPAASPSASASAHP
jgi:hypothetical protein